jgi:hypothetical protein
MADSCGYGNFLPSARVSFQSLTLQRVELNLKCFGYYKHFAEKTDLIDLFFFTNISMTKKTHLSGYLYVMLLKCIIHG